MIENLEYQATIKIINNIDLPKLGDFDMAIICKILL
jgi:hypothetical protein